MKILKLKLKCKIKKNLFKINNLEKSKYSI